MSRNQSLLCCSEHQRHREIKWRLIQQFFDVITSFFSGYIFGAGTTAHRHTRTVMHDVTAVAVTIATMYYKLLCCLLCMCASFKRNKRNTYNPESSLAKMYQKVLQNFVLICHTCFMPYNPWQGSIYGHGAITCVIGRTVHALDVITSISRYDSRSNLLHFFYVFCIVNCDIIILHKPTKCRLSKVIF